LRDARGAKARHDVAKIDADPNPDPAVLGNIGLSLGHFALQDDSTFHCIDDAGILQLSS
jgi:hypothetical protein